MTNTIDPAEWVRILHPPGHRRYERSSKPPIPPELMNVIVVMDAPDDLWVCDACNDDLDYESSEVLVGPHGWGAVCRKCRERYHGGAVKTSKTAVDCGCFGCLAPSR